MICYYYYIYLFIYIDFYVFIYSSIYLFIYLFIHVFYGGYLVLHRPIYTLLFQMQLRKYKDNEGEMCDTVDYNFSDLRWYVIIEVSLELHYIVLWWPYKKKTSSSTEFN